MAVPLEYRLGKLAAAVALTLLLPATAWAGSWQITPSVNVNETYTDNVGLAATNRRSDWITDIAPGINIAGTGDRVKLQFDYRLHKLFYAQDSGRNSHQNALNARGTLEAVDNWLFIDADAVVAQQNISAFRGASSSTSVDVNSSSNSTETRSYRLSPFIKGNLGNFAEYQLRYNLSHFSSDAVNVGDTATRQWALHLAGLQTYAQFGWVLDANTMRSDFQRGRETRTDLLRGMLIWQYDPQFRLLFIGGREGNNYTSSEIESRTLKGLGFEWAPTERTQLSATRERRFFGNSDNLNFEHRTAGTVWKYRQSKDAVTATNQNSGTVGTIFDLYMALFRAANPTLSEAQLSAFVTNLLLANGISPAAQLQGGFVTTSVSLQKRRELSFALVGSRNTVTFAATRSESSALGQGVGTGIFTGTDFASVNNIAQRGVSVNWAHKLTGLSTLTGTVSRLDSQGRGGASLDATQKIYSLNFVTQLGPKTNAGLGVRRTEFDGSAQYNENALTGMISHRF